MLDNIHKDIANATEILLKSILDSAFHGIMSFRAIRNGDKKIIDFEWLFVNDVAEEILGVPSLVGKQLLKEVPDNDISELFDRYVRVVETGSYELFEKQFGSAQNPKWFRVSIVKLEDGVTVTFQDISDLKEAIQESKTEQIKYRRLFEESIDSIFQVNTAYQFLAVNPSFEKLFGHDQNSLQHMSLQELFLTKGSFEAFARLLNENLGVDEFECVLKDKRGRKKACLINCVRVKTDTNADDIFIGVIRDMTKRKQADRELVQAEKLAMTGKIARTIAHEVRNPLTNLSLAVQQLQDELPADLEDAELYIKIIERNADRIGDLISDLLNSSKPKALKLVDRSLNDVVKETLALVRDRLKLQSMEVVEDYEAALPRIPLDEDQLKVALLNLLINAIEAMEPDTGELKIHTHFEDGEVYLDIADNGKGLSNEDLSRLFEPYFTGKTDGTGLGLTTVQNIISSHKGKIEVESEVGTGTTFSIIFPLNK